MKLSKKFFAIAGVFLVVASVVIISCRKDASNASDGKSVKVVTTAKQMTLSWDLSTPVGRAAAPVCDKHGGAVSLELEWDLATCRSQCTRGLGFRCGRRTRLFCADGYFQESINYGSCPNGASVYNRAMTANPTFYTDGSVKLTFLHEVPAEEAGNTNFEIEVDEVVDLPDGILLDGNAYKGFEPKVGVFKVDYSDGRYGSVTLPGILIPK